MTDQIAPSHMETRVRLRAPIWLFGPAAIVSGALVSSFLTFLSSNLFVSVRDSLIRALENATLSLFWVPALLCLIEFQPVKTSWGVLGLGLGATAFMTLLGGVILIFNFQAAAPGLQQGGGLLALLSFIALNGLGQILTAIPATLMIRFVCLQKR